MAKQSRQSYRTRLATPLRNGRPSPVRRFLGVLKRCPSLYAFLRHDIYARMRSLNRQQIFLKVYERNFWDGLSSVSGPGSSLESTRPLRKALPKLFETLGARSILDIPCGDLHWMKNVSLGVEQYIGADIVLPLIQQNREMFGDRGEFLHLDLLRDPLPSVDVVFCRDCLVHLSFREIRLALQSVKAAAPKYFITTTFPYHKENVDTVTPYWRALNMQLVPFNFPEPIHLIKDFSDAQANDQGKYLGVWQADGLCDLWAKSS
jgi:SAM-dependent methyltransferase